MKEGPVRRDVVVVADDESAEVAEPSEHALHDPTLAVSAEWSTILQLHARSPASMRTDHLDSTLPATNTQIVAVVSAIEDQSFSLAVDRDRVERRLRELDLRGRCRGKLASQRNTLAVDHHHPLCSLAALGLADALAPFFAGAKLPSMKVSLQSSLPRSSSSERNARHRSNHTSSSSHLRSRRQHVGPLGNSGGISRQRAPVLSTHKIPSSTSRLFAHGRPWLFNLGSSGSILAHCASLNCRFGPTGIHLLCNRSAGHCV